MKSWCALVLVVTCVAALFRASSVLACACCDGSTSRQPLGWTANGRAVLIQATTFAGCERRVALEIWRVGARAPSGCYDLLSGDPETRVDCASVAESWTAPIGASSRTRHFPIPAVSVSSDQLRIASRRTRRAGHPALAFVLDLVTPSGPVRLWSGRAGIADGAGGGDERSAPVFPVPTVWRSPNNRDAFILVEGDYVEPSIGHSASPLYWTSVSGATN